MIHCSCVLTQESGSCGVGAQLAHNSFLTDGNAGTSKVREWTPAQPSGLALVSKGK